MTAIYQLFERVEKFSGRLNIPFYIVGCQVIKIVIIAGLSHFKQFGEKTSLLSGEWSVCYIMQADKVYDAFMGMRIIAILYQKCRRHIIAGII